MTTFLLIRHGVTDDVGHTISGTAAGVHLNDEGRRQASELAARLAPIRLDVIVSSPLERTRETAAPLAASRGATVETITALQELAFGDWTGRPFAALEQDPRWRQYNTVRSVVGTPAGELMLAVQLRAVAALLQLHERYPSANVAVISHGDVIRAALLFFLGMPIDFVHRLEVSPARVSIVRLDQDAPAVLQVNGDNATLLA